MKIKEMSTQPGPVSGALQNYMMLLRPYTLQTGLVETIEQSSWAHQMIVVREQMYNTRCMIYKRLSMCQAMSVIESQVNDTRTK